MLKEFQVTSTITIEAKSLKEAEDKVYKENNYAYALASNAEIEEVENG